MGMEFGEAVFLGRVSFFRQGNSKWPSHSAWEEPTGVLAKVV